MPWRVVDVDWIFDQEASYWHIQVTCNRQGGSHRKRFDLARQARRWAAHHEAGAAVREVLFGNAPEARRSALSALDLSNNRDAESGAALALALSGGSSQAQTLADDLEKRFPDDAFVKLSYLPALRALLALHPTRKGRCEPAKAIELLQVAAPL